MMRLRATLLCLLLAACAGRDEPVPAREFDGARALQRVQEQVAFGPRIPGTAPHAAMAAWLDSLSRAGADTVIVQRWWHHPQHGDSIPQVNIIARFKPQAASRLLYLAHWDTRPRANGPGSTDTLAPVPGANDGGSGVAVLLGVMDALHKSPPAIGVDLVFADGEDFGLFDGPNRDVLIGARYYAQHPVTADKPLFAVVWDMVGDSDLQLKVEDFSLAAAPEAVDQVWGTAEQMGYGHLFVRAQQGGVTDDHSPLIEAGFRAIDVIDLQYPSWHRATDTPDKVSAQSLEAVGNVAVAVIRKQGK